MSLQFGKCDFDSLPLSAMENNFRVWVTRFDYLDDLDVTWAVSTVSITPDMRNLE